MGSGTSGLVDGADAPVDRDARIEANSKALWAHILTHAVDKSRNAAENPEDSSNVRTQAYQEGECRVCTFLNDPSITNCSMCGEQISPSIEPLNRTSSLHSPIHHSPAASPLRSPVNQSPASPLRFPKLKLHRREATSLVIKVVDDVMEHMSLEYRPYNRESPVEWRSGPDQLNIEQDLVIQGLIPDTLYEVRSCVGGVPVGPTSKVRTGPSICGAPPAPNASEIGRDFVMLHWQQPAILNGLPVESYVVRMKLFGGQFSECYRGIETVFVANGLNPQSVYVFQVAAVNALGQGQWSASAAFRTKTTAEPQSMWISSVASNLQEFFYHPATNQSCWTLPQGAILDETSSFRTKRRRFLEELHVKATTVLSQEEEEIVQPSSPLNGGEGEMPMVFPPLFTRIKVNRSDIVNSSYRAFQALSEKELRRPLRIIFIGEEGIDSGGMVKDWFIEMSHALVRGELGFFTHTDEKDVYKIDSRSSFIHELSQLESFFEFIGTFLGKAVLDHQTIDVRFDRTLLQQFLRIPVEMEDLAKFDRHHYAGLTWMLENKIEGVLEETFSVAVEVMGEMKMVDLKHGGSTIDVNDENKEEYVKLMLFHLTAGCCLPQLEALVHGFHRLVPLETLISNMISADDLQTLLLGVDELDVFAIEAVTKYTGGYDETSQPVIWFWQAFKAFSPTEQKALLRFITGLHKIPLDGFDPPLMITKSAHESGSTSLPRSHTCFNQLALPPYDSYETLVSKIRFAVENTPSEFLMS